MRQFRIGAVQTTPSAQIPALRSREPIHRRRNFNIRALFPSNISGRDFNSRESSTPEVASSTPEAHEIDRVFTHLMRVRACVMG